MTPLLKSIGNASAFWFILPCLLVLAITSVYPVGFGLAISLTNWNWGNQLDFVGFANYVAIAFQRFRVLDGSAQHGRLSRRRRP